MDFRVDKPVRRPITTAVAKYSNHKPDLKIDFFSRCGYCNATDTWKTVYYEVDHFIPYKREKKIFLTIKTPEDYSNLVYSCRSCNNAKRNKWPTNNQNVPNRNNEGFVDPCDAQYVNHFERTDNGEIQYTTDLGEWMYYALKLHKPHHQVVWQLEQLEPIVKQIKSITDLSKIPVNIKDMIINLLIRYDNYRDELRDI
jgi:hypothetical protein